MPDNTKPASLPLGFRKTIFYRWTLFGTLAYGNTTIPNSEPQDDLLHYNTILSGEKKKGALILGAQPLDSLREHKLDQGSKIIELCEKKHKPLGMVVSVLTPEEMAGTGSRNTPVSAQFWEAQKPKVAHILIPIKDHSASIDLQMLKKAIDDVDEIRKNKQSTYIHCNADYGRSFTFVMCYLMLHTKMTLNEALDEIYHKRHQIYPTDSQLKLIEAFRQSYCNDNKSETYKAPLDLSALKLSPIRNKFTIIAENPILHTIMGAGFGYGASLFLLGLVGYSALLFAGVGGIVLGALSLISQNIRHHLRDSAYLKLPQVHIAKPIKDPKQKDVKAQLLAQRHEKLREELSKYNIAELKALECGSESADSWLSYLAPKRMLNPNATWHYTKYLAGMRAKYEQDGITKPDVLPEIIKQKLKPAA